MNNKKGITNYPIQLCLHEIFASRVREQPQATALIYNGKSLTYAELDQKSTHLAQHLLRLGVQPEQLVAICMERSLEMIIGIIGILKAGAAYVPIDVDYPQDRLSFMIADSATTVVLTQRTLLPRLPSGDIHLLTLDDYKWDKKVSTTQQLLPISLPTQMAYCIYTSGSTGKPKGVMITHQNLVHQLQGQHQIAPDAIGKMILTCSISFDVSVLTIFWTLLSGAPLLIPNQGEEKDIDRLLDLIEKEAVTHILTLPSLHTLILEYAQPSQLRSLRLVNVSGEVCPTSLAQRHEAVCPQAQLYNLYGPTEATINCTYFPLPPDYHQPKVPIGKPIANYDIFILDAQAQIVPSGTVGEIYIGGKHVVGRGYWNRPKLSAERFVNNPYVSERGGATLYKTGDLGRWQLDGNIEFLGRADYQVKFRGYRIELGEIEAVLSNHAQVKEVVVVLKNPTDYSQQRLVAYLTTHTTTDEPPCSVTALRTFLGRVLPEYMLPSQFVFLKKMPLTTNGKFDRKALPEPPQERPLLAQSYTAPQGELERYLTQQWESLLQLSPIGRHDKFFELGGNSIQAARFIGQLSQQMNTSIFVTTIFDKPTIAAYAKMLQTTYKKEVQQLLQQTVGDANQNSGSQKSDSQLPDDTTTNTEVNKRKPVKLTPFEIEHFEQYIPKINPPHSTQETTKNKPAIFILAPPRSGTTLLRVMLAGHPDLFAANELQLLGFQDLKERSQAYQSKFKLWSEGLIRAIMELQGLNADEAKSLIARYEEAGYTTQEVYRQLQDWIGDLILVDKSPSYALDPQVLQKAEIDFDNALYIHLVRHPYTMVKSLEQYHLDQVLYLLPHDYPARELGELVWLHSHRNIVQFLRDIPAHRQFRLRYEDLVREPERIMDELCQTLGLPFNEGLLTPYAHTETKMMDGIYKDSRSMGDTNLLRQRSINASKADEWKQVFKDNFLSDESWDWMEYFGYVGDVKNGNGKLGDSSFFTPPPITQVVNNQSTSTFITAPSRAAHTQPPIAIVGMACRLPGANTLDEFWENLVQGIDVSEGIAPEDIEQSGISIEQFKQDNWVRRRLMLSEADSFDAAFFGYSPQEAKLMDPQHRVFLEVAYQALENAGYDPYTYTGRIGIFGGVARNAYFTNNVATDPRRLVTAGDYIDMLGYEKNFSVTRVAYKLNLRGPAVNVQTACSSTGVGVHLACQSIWQGDSDMVLVGGGRIQPDLKAGYEYTEGGPLSPDGYIRAFDAGARGMVKGNGMVFLVLKPLEHAIRDGDHVWATIQSTAINNDGANKIGFTAPSVQGQAVAIRQAHQKAGITADQVDYVEAHGTGTLLGDPIEVQGLTEAFRQTTDKRQFCAIGSVKTNIGHLDAGACVAGMMKVALAMKYETLPASLNFERPNPQIDFERSPFYVSASTRAWIRNGKPRRAGVSSFGLGGTNAHIIMQDAPLSAPLPPQRTDDAQLYLLSAKTQTALQEMEEQLVAYIENNPKQIHNHIAYTLATGRAQWQQRSALIIKGVDVSRISSNPAISHPSHKLPPSSITTDEARPELVFLFSGGGAQYVNMARDLYTEHYAFRQIVDRGFDYVEQHEQLFLRPLVFPERENTTELQHELERPSRALPALFIIEYALAQLWQSWGVRPTAVVGHSMGEYTAACIAGVMTWKEALSLVSLRGRLFEKLPDTGAMLSVALSETAIQPYLTSSLSVAVINKFDTSVVAGTLGGIEILEQRLGQLGIECKRIRIAVAAHSPQIDPILPEFQAHLEQLNFQPPTLPIISNATGDWADSSEIVTANYWLRHIRQTVRFADGLTTILASDSATLLEVGPGQTLATFARQHRDKTAQHQVLASVRHRREQQQDVVFIYKTLAKLWTQSYPIDWSGFFAHQDTRRIPLPTYPFERKRFWIPPTKTRPISNSITPMAQNIPPTVINSAIAVAKPQPVESAAIPQPTSPVTSPTPVSPQQQLVEDIQQMLQDMSGYTPEDLAPAATFLELGFDSLFLSQVVIQFNKRYDLTLSFRQLFEEANTIRNLADYAFANGIQLAAPPTPIEPTPPTTVEHTPTQRTVTTTPPATIVSTDERMPVPQSWEALFSQQIALLQQQLALLQNASGQPPSSTPDPRIVPSPPLSASPTTTSAPSDKTIRLRPTAKKGVTSKLKGYGTRSTTDELNEQQRAAIEVFTARYVVKTAQSKALARQHRQYYADPRTLSGFNKNWKEIVYQIASERSKGSRFWDIDGNEYIDFVMSYGVALFGHSPDFIMDAVRAQITNGTGLDTLTPLATEVAQIICRLSGMDRMTLANTGTEAVVGAIRAARAATGRDKIIIFDTDYHGLTDEFMLRGITVRGNTKAVPLAPGIPKAVQQSVVILDWDDPNIITKIRNHADDLAAVLVEPVQAQNPHWQHHDILRAIRQVTEELDVALVFDEVINGFRLLQGGAQEWFGIKADLVAYGKTVSGGLPCAAFAGKHRYMDVFDGGIWQFGDDSAPEAMPTYFAGTFIKNPVSVAASLAAMREIERRGTSLQLELNARMAQFATQLSELFLRLKAPLFIQSTSSIFIIKFVDKYPTNPLFYDILRFHGVNMRARPCFLSTAHTDEDLAQTLQLVERTLRDMLEEQLLQPYTGENLNEIYIPKTVEVATADATTTTLKRSSSSSLNVAPTDESPISTTARQIPLTAGQQEIFLNHQLSSEAARAYNIGTELRLSGQLNVAAFQTAIQLLVERHEALRTAIDASGKTQTIFEARSCTIQLEDLSQEQSNTQQLVLADYRIATMEQAFDLQQDELSRWCLFKLDVDEYVLFLTVHHIICDGWSLGILTRELGELYARECGLAHQNLTLPKSLTDYATERIAFGQTADFQKNQAYWLAQFKDGVPTSTVPADAARPPLKTYRGSTQKTRFTAAETTQLKQLAAQQGTTLYVYFLTAFATFLHKWSDESDWVIGIAAAGHNQPGNGSVVGHLIDLLPLRLQIDANDTFEQHIRQTRTRVLDAFDHQPYTFGTLVQQLNMRRDASRNALVSVAFNMDAPLQDLNCGNVQMQPQGVPHRYETFDVFINLKPIGDVIDLEWNFNTDLFQSELVARRLEVFRTWMANLGTSPNLPISQLSDMPSAQLETLRCWSTGPTRRYPVTESMHGLMTRQAAWTPAKVACISEGMVLTFEQLDKDSTLLASYLLEQGLTTHSFVGLSINRSAQMLVAMFAILKTGCAYVPIDPRNPIDRIALLLEDADCQALITTSDLGLGELAILPSLSLGVLETDRIAWRRGGGHPLPQTRATDNAYVIYTSGSTGKPKGVVVRHESAINTLFAINEHLQMGVQDKIYSVSSMAFDMSIPDYFLPTAVGATLILASEAAKKDGFLLKEEMERYRPTVMQATPTTWKMLLLSGWEGDSALTVVAGGEGLSKDTARALVSSCKAVYNGYGPTEATIYTTYKLVTAAHLDQEAIGEFAAIGQPLANVTTHVLDEQMHPTPIGKSGELYIGGIGLSKGYLKQATRTAKSFVDSPYGKLYRTGDLVRYLPNGDLDFLGRIDHQVKIRGYRIELGEIEVALQQHPAVQQAATKVIRQTENHPQLVAYVVGERLRNYGGISPMSEEFRTFLRTSLPGYMIPAFFIELDRFPLTTSLKIDRKQLPAPVFATQQRQVLQPQTKHEQMLVQLFAELLGLTTVGVHDNFFELGGHSLVAVELMSRIRQQTGYQLPLTTLFQHATVRQLAMVLEEQEKQQSATKVVSKQAFSSLIPIRTTGSKPPIYLVHGGGLHVLFYQTLVQHLGEDQPVYALQARGLSGNETPLERIEDMAAHYLKEIAQVHPTDAPYHLAGYSLGGLIAWEMAKQLREQQQEVGILALFDAVAKAATVNGVNDKWAKKWNKATYNLKLFAKQPARAFRYKKHVLNMRYQHIKGKLNIAYRNNKTGEIEESHLPYGKEVYEKSLRAFELYELAPVDVKVQLFKAAEQMFYLKDPEFLGWKAYALRGIVTHDIPGDHLTLFDAPNDAIIGNILRQLTDVEV